MLTLLGRVVVGRVALVRADLALGQRHAQVGRLLVLELDVDVHVRRVRIAMAHVGVRALGLEDIPFRDGDAGRLQEFDLLDLVIVDRGGQRQHVHVVLKEGLLLDLGDFRQGRRPKHTAATGARRHRPRPVHVAGDELDLGVLEARAAAVLDRDPAREVHLRVVGRDGGGVIGAPRHVVGLVRDPREVLAGLGREDLPDERGLRQQALGQRGKVDVGHVVHPRDHGHAVLGLQNDLALVERGQAALDRLALLVRDGDLLVDVAAQERIGRDHVELVVLLEDAGAVGIGQALELDGRGIDVACDVSELEFRDLGVELQAPGLAHDAKVLIVDRQGDPFGVGRRRRRLILGRRGACCARKGHCHARRQDGQGCCSEPQAVPSHREFLSHFRLNVRGRCATADLRRGTRMRITSI